MAKNLDLSPDSGGYMKAETLDTVNEIADYIRLTGRLRKLKQKGEQATPLQMTKYTKLKKEYGTLPESSSSTATKKVEIVL